MPAESTRTFERRMCKGKVLVYHIGGGPPIHGELRNLAKGGACLVVDRPLARGDGLRLVFPHKSGTNGQAGRMILGHVAHSRTDGRGHVVGVTFGWHAAVKDGPRLIRKKTKFSWLGLFTRVAKTPAVPSARTR